MLPRYNLPSRAIHAMMQRSIVAGRISADRRPTP
jgi:hypothetical protein